MKALKYVGITLFIIVLLIGLTILFFTTLFNPNHFKPLLTSQIKKYIHREVTIGGNLSWAFFPNFGIKVEHIIITNPPEIKQKLVVDIAKTTLDVPLQAMLHRKLEILGINLTDADIVWMDTKTNQYYEIKNAELHAKNLKLMEDFPLSLQFDFQVNKTMAEISLNGSIYIDNVKQTLVYHDVSGNIANMPISGTISATNLSADQVITGHVVINAFDLKQTLKDLGKDVSNIQTANNAQGNLDFSISNAGTNAQGVFTVRSLQVNNLALNNVRMQPRLQRGVLDLSPVTASLYQGTLQSQVKIDFNTIKPTLAVNAQLRNIQSEPLLRDFSDSQKITVASKGDIDIQVTMNGDDTKTLNGSGKFNFGNGSLNGINLSYYINSAYAIINRQPPGSQTTNQTPFDSFTGTLLIQNGVLINSDLLIESPSFETKGNGKIDLPSHWINYLLYTTIKKHTPDQKDDLTNLYGIAIPIAIRGNLSNPMISLDAGEIIKAITAKQLEGTKQNTKEQIRNQVKEQIQKYVPGNAGQLLQELIKH